MHFLLKKDLKPGRGPALESKKYYFQNTTKRLLLMLSTINIELRAEDTRSKISRNKKPFPKCYASSSRSSITCFVDHDARLHQSLPELHPEPRSHPAKQGEGGARRRRWGRPHLRHGRPGRGVQSSGGRVRLRPAGGGVGWGGAPNRGGSGGRGRRNGARRGEILEALIFIILRRATAASWRLKKRVLPQKQRHRRLRHDVTSARRSFFSFLRWRVPVQGMTSTTRSITLSPSCVYKLLFLPCSEIARYFLKPFARKRRHPINLGDNASPRLAIFRRVFFRARVNSLLKVMSLVCNSRLAASDWAVPGLIDCCVLLFLFCL